MVRRSKALNNPWLLKKSLKHPLRRLRNIKAKSRCSKGFRNKALNRQRVTHWRKKRTFKWMGKRAKWKKLWWMPECMDRLSDQLCTLKTSLIHLLLRRTNLTNQSSRELTRNLNPNTGHLWKIVSSSQERSSSTRSKSPKHGLIMSLLWSLFMMQSTMLHCLMTIWRLASL